MQAGGGRGVAGRDERPVAGDGRAEATADDLARALSLYRTACLIQGGLVLTLLTLWFVGIG